MPHEGTTPRYASPVRNFAVDDARRTSHAIAMAKPPPMHQPRIAAITGLPIVSTRSTTRRPSSRNRAASWPARGPPERSAPAENAFVPAPVSTMHRVASRASRSSSAVSTSRMSAGETAFTGGRLSVSVETPAVCTTRSVS